MKKPYASLFLANFIPIFFDILFYFSQYLFKNEYQFNLFLIDFLLIDTFVIPITLLGINEKHRAKYNSYKLYINIIVMWAITILGIIIKCLPDLLSGNINLNDSEELLGFAAILAPTFVMTLLISLILYSSNSKPNGKISY